MKNASVKEHCCNLFYQKSSKIIRNKKKWQGKADKTITEAEAAVATENDKKKKKQKLKIRAKNDDFSLKRC